MAGTVRLEVDLEDTEGTITNISLESQGGSFGIRRKDTGSVIVANGTPATWSGNIATYESDQIDPTVTYEVAWRVDWTFGAITHTDWVVAELIGRVARRSLRYAREQLARMLGGFGTFITDSTSPDNRTLVSTSLINEAIDEGFYNYNWLYARSGNLYRTQRQVVADSFNNAEGSVKVSRPYSVTPEPGNEIELTTHLPVLSEMKINGLNWCINEALSYLWIIAREEMPENTIEIYDDLPEWIYDSAQIKGVYRSIGSNFVKEAVTNDYVFSYNAGTPMLHGPWVSTTSDMEIAIWKRANLWIRRGGVWTDANGLEDDSDEFAVDPDLVREVAYFIALQEASKVPFIGPQESSILQTKAQMQAVIAANIKRSSEENMLNSPNFRERTGPRPIWGMKGMIW